MDVNADLRIWKQDPEANIWAQKGCELGVEKAYSEELHILYRSPNIVKVIKCRRLRWADHVARMEEGRNAFKMLTGRLHIQERGPRSRWEVNIRMGLKEIVINTRNFVDSAQDKDYWRTLVNATLNLRVPSSMDLVC